MSWQWSLALASIRKQRLQSLLLILGVALGCAVIIAIDLANQSARAGFALSAETLTGKATHQITAPNGVPDRWYREIKRAFPDLPSAPVVSAYVKVPQLRGRPLRLLGLDPLAEAPFRNYLNARGQGGTNPGPGTLYFPHGHPDHGARARPGIKHHPVYNAPSDSGELWRPNLRA